MREHPTLVVLVLALILTQRFGHGVYDLSFAGLSTIGVTGDFDRLSINVRQQCACLASIPYGFLAGDSHVA